MKMIAESGPVEASSISICGAVNLLAAIFGEDPKALLERYGLCCCRRRSRKWDYSKVYALKDGNGWGSFKISRALGMPEGTVSWILYQRKVSLGAERQPNVPLSPALRLNQAVGSLARSRKEKD